MNLWRLFVTLFAATALIFAAVAAGGCNNGDDDDDGATVINDDDDDTGPSDTTDVTPPPADPDIIIEPAGIAAVFTDFFSTFGLATIGYGDSDFSHEKVVDSSTADPELTTAFSNDTVASTNPNADHKIVLIDRTSGIITIVDPETSDVILQIDVAGGEALNPYDTLLVTDTKAYATRYQVVGDDGGDVIVFDHTTGEIGEAIDLTPYTTTDTTQPRPDHLIRAYGRIWVSLNNISADFMTYGPGVLVAIDPETDEVVDSLVLTGYQNCGGMEYDPVANILYVVCSGDWDGDFSDSGLVAVDVSADPPTITAQWSAEDITGGDQKLGSFVTRTDSKIFAATVDPSWTDPLADRLYEIDIASNASTEIFEAGGAFAINGILADGENGLLYVSDATFGGPKLRIFDTFADPATQTAELENSQMGSLGPNVLSFY